MSLQNLNSASGEFISGWGLYPVVKAKIKKPKNLSELIKAFRDRDCIARGNGRSYGDSSINKFNTIDMSNFNRLLYFDEKKGLVIAQAGVLLKDIIDTFLPKRWFPGVTPGTKYVTLGGMVAADVHGKNHYKNGTFVNFVEWIEILNNDGKIIRCSRKENINLFFWTFGGMGLTGIIINIAFYLQPIESAWINKKTLVAKNIKQTIELFEKNINSTYSVAWIDCYAKGNKLGRSLVMLGEHSKKEEINPCYKLNPFKIPIKKKVSIPFFLPSFILTNLSVRIFNFLYFLKGRISKGKKIVDWDSFFYPLDKIQNWNKIYGSKGFIQFQCVIPLNKSKKGITELLECISNSKSSSFLAVLKRFGLHQSQFSFPMEGYSLALDFPINKENLILINSLDEITIKNGGRFYLAKDSRMIKKNFDRSDKRIKQFRTYREENFFKKYNSCQSDRLDL